MKIIILALITVVMIFTACGGDDKSSQIEFQVRLVEEASAPAVEEKTLHYTGERFLLHPEVIISNKHVKDAEFGNLDALTSIHITLNEEGTKILENVTANNIDRRMGVLLDGEIVAAPFIRDTIRDGRFAFTGDFTIAEAESYAKNILK